MEVSLGRRSSQPSCTLHHRKSSYSAYECFAPTWYLRHLTWRHCRRHQWGVPPLALRNGWGAEKASNCSTSLGRWQIKWPLIQIHHFWTDGAYSHRRSTHLPAHRQPKDGNQSFRNPGRSSDVFDRRSSDRVQFSSGIWCIVEGRVAYTPPHPTKTALGAANCSQACRGLLPWWNPWWSS